jgi:hypothetical protein
VLAPSELGAIRRAGALRFHCVGDTGGLHNPGPQREVAAAMVAQLGGDQPVRFFFHLGDIVYLHGEEAGYEPQFVAPYAAYTAPILAIAGNHDGDLAPDGGEAALAAFMRHFCAPPGPFGADKRRPADRLVYQPNVYWTLRHEWVTIIGLYTDVPDGGHLGEGQLQWLVGELRAAPRGITLILAMHHPVFSADTAHGSNLALGDRLDRCFERAGRAPDAVFSAHAHNYQRFTRLHDGLEIPYVVAGSGGFRELHALGFGVPDTPASFAGLSGVTLERYQDERFGFLTVTAAPSGAVVHYNTVADGRPVPFDCFRIAPAAAG